MCREKKTISIVIPVYNERAMLDEVYRRMTAVMQTITDYDYELVFFDDGSTDGSREKITALCVLDKKVKAVFYSKNFGYSKNIFYAMQQAKGDCAILLHADLQNPPELIPEFIKRWETGATIVLGIKNKSRENKFMYFMRSVFYWIMNAVFGMSLIPHATDFELFDKSFIDILKQCNYKNPFLRGIIAEYGSAVDCIYYTQDRRTEGKSKFNLNKYYDFAVCGIVNMSKKLPRKILLFGLICILLSLVEFFFICIPRIHAHAIADIASHLLLRGGIVVLEINMIFNAVIAEYVISAAASADQKPLVVEQKRINY
ncbi:MAG: glycosyltransferase family 2 protein [Clostridia bacterium]|nr:glycosyltransferase family 2 protein [Clostridia bacterium]